MALSVLYPPRSSTIVPAVDIVAVHGLAGDAIETWTDLQSQAFWLRDFLPKQIPDARILTFGYNATAAFSKTSAVLSEHAQSLIECLDDKREESNEQKRPLIFLAHSLGGIVVKQALLLASLESRYRNIRDATIGIIFFDTPHRRSKRVEYGQMLVNVAETLFTKPRPTLLRALQANAATYETLTADFVRTMPRYQIVSFYEHPLVGGYSSRLVESNSSETVLVEQQIMVDIDHIAMCKLNQGDDTLGKVYKNIKLMRDQPARSAAPKSDQSRRMDNKPAVQNHLLGTVLGEASSTDNTNGDIDSMHALATQHSDAGRVTEAIELEKLVVAGRMQKLGEDAPDTLQAMHDLSFFYGEARQYNDAAQLAEQVVAIRKRVLGAGALSTLRSMLNLATYYSMTDQYLKAIDLGDEVVRLNPGDETLTIQSLHILAFVNSEAGRYDEAIKIGEEVVALRKKVLGDDSPSTIKSMHNLASDYSSANRHREAVRLGEQVVELSQTKLGINHPQTFLSMNRLVIGYHRADRTEDAIQLAWELIELQTSNLGEGHPDTVVTKSLLAEMLDQQKEAENKKELEKKASASQEGYMAYRQTKPLPVSVPRKPDPVEDLPAVVTSPPQKSSSKFSRFLRRF